ncbi:subtilisin-like protein, partial [Fragilariopsis cylindrus CCMP1102]
MINIQYVWNTLKYTGKGIVVRINDDGVDINNKEFEGNNKFDEKNSCKSFEPNVDDLDGHGTSVAGIVLGNANNDFCSAGIAYDSTFSACNFFAKDVPYSSLAYKVNTFDISQNSIGSPACSAGQLTQGNNMDIDTIDALATGVTEGRNGKGIVFVFASGNKFYEGEDINMSGWTNSRYTITVGAVGKDGKHTDYSTPGAALMVTGPAGDFNDVGHIITAGLGGTCANSGSGTSFSCPVVSGVIALMLEARGELTWRDVQGIIASTSKKVKDSEDKSAQTNIAGVWHSDWYGFGIIDAKKAVNTALKWDLWSPEEQAMGISDDEDKPIPNNGIEFVSELTVGSEYKGFISESVVVLLDLQHYSRGDLKVTLISPKGTQSVLHAGKRPEATQTKGDQRWKLMTVRTWGEDPTGIWKLKLQDLVVDIDSTTADSVNGFKNWKLTAYGRSDD